MTKCKEYLDIDNGYALITADDEIKGGSNWIEVPHGAEIFCFNAPKYAFYKNNGKLCCCAGGLVWSESKWTNEELIKASYVNVLWQRSETKKVQGGKSAGLKYDSDKPRYSLLPKGAVNSVVSVLEFGAKKYEADNWQKVDNAKERYYNAAMRHIDLWWNGEKCDPETNIHHLAHAATNLFFLMWFDEK